MSKSPRYTKSAETEHEHEEKTPRGSIASAVDKKQKDSIMVSPKMARKKKRDTKDGICVHERNKTKSPIFESEKVK